MTQRADRNTESAENAIDWNGQSMGAGPLGLAILTRPATEQRADPVLVVVAVTNGESRCVVQPERLGAFLRVHDPISILCSDAGPFFWTLIRYFGSSSDRQSEIILWDHLRANRLFDVILLGQLVDLARSGSEAPAATLSALALARKVQPPWEARDVQPITTTAYGRPRDSSESALRNQAVQEADLTFTLYRLLKADADQIIAEQDISPENVARFGTLTLGLQVKASIALHQAAQSRFRSENIPGLRAHCETIVEDCSRELFQDVEAQSCFKWIEAEGGPRVELDSSGRIGDHSQRLKKWLAKRLGMVSGHHSIPLQPPRTGPGRIATTSRFWGELTYGDRLLSAWARLEDAVNLRRCLEASRVAGGVLRPEYEALPRIGSQNPDLERTRQLSPSLVFRPRSGYALLIVELPDLDLRCLAECCVLVGLESRLAELFRRDVDPALFAMGVLYWPDVGTRRDRFEELRREAPAEFEERLEVTRALLHSACRGLGPAHAREILKRTTKSDLNGHDVEDCLKAIERVILPELRSYYADNTLDSLTEKFGCDPRDTWKLTGGTKWLGQSLHTLREAILGQENRPELFSTLREICQDRGWRKRLSAGKGSPQLFDDIFRRTAVSPIGRVRGGGYFLQAEASRVLDLADDVRKLVIFSLVEKGHELVAVVGDTLVFSIGRRDALDITRFEKLSERVRSLIECSVRDAISTVPMKSTLQHATVWRSDDPALDGEGKTNLVI